MNEDSSACINSSSVTVQGPRIPLYPSAFSKSTANVHSADWLVATEHEENAVAPTMHKLSSISHELDLPLLQTGGIHAHLALDNLAVQAIFQPDIVAFWEVAMGINTDTMLRTEVDTALEGRREGVEVDDEEVDGRNDIGMQASECNIDNGSESGSSYCASPRLQAMDYTSRIHHVTHMPHFDKVGLPLHLAGLAFSEVFETMLTQHGVIVVALWRHERHSHDKDLPFVLTAPLPPALVLEKDDALFVITK